jgi:hypothetical protein
MWKRCNHCNYPQHYTSFSRSKQNKDGRLNLCKACDRALKVWWYSTNIDRERVKRREWQDTHVEEHKFHVACYQKTEKGKIVTKRYSDKYRRRVREDRYNRRYGLV